MIITLALTINFILCVTSVTSVVSDSATLWTVCSLPGSSVHGFLQARILEWVVESSSREDIPHPGIKPKFLALQADSSLLSPWGSPLHTTYMGKLQKGWLRNKILDAKCRETQEL